MTGRPPRGGSTQPMPRCAAALLLAMEQVYDEGCRRGRLADFAASAKRPVEERIKALEYPRRSGSQGAAVGRQVVGHSAGQGQTAGQDDCLGRDAARDGDDPRAGDG